MSIRPDQFPESDDFPGDSTPQPLLGFKDSLRSIGIWSIGAPHLAFWAWYTVLLSKSGNLKRRDGAIKWMTRAVPALAGVHIETKNAEILDPNGTYVYVVNHVNIFDMFAIYQSIPQYTRSLEHVEHFSWPVFGTFIKAAGQIPVDPANPKLTARGLKKAERMLRHGDSLVVLPEGQRTLDGTVGHFYPGAFRLAIRAGVPVVPMAIHGGRRISRRGDWRVRPGKMTVRFGDPVSTDGYHIRDAQSFGDDCRQRVIQLLQNENRNS